MSNVPVGLMAPITSMAEFETRARQIQEYVDDCATVVAYWAAAIVSEAPVVVACKAAAETMANVLRTIPPQVGEVLTITRTQQAALWGYFVDGEGASNPNAGMWPGRA